MNTLKFRFKSPCSFPENLSVSTLPTIFNISYNFSDYYSGNPYANEFTNDAYLDNETFDKLKLPPKLYFTPLLELKRNPYNLNLFSKIRRIPDAELTQDHIPEMKNLAKSFYLEIFRIGRQWPDLQASNYILLELRELYQRNERMKHPIDIRARLIEANDRLDTALHYGNPVMRRMQMPRFTDTEVRHSYSSIPSTNYSSYNPIFTRDTTKTTTNTSTNVYGQDIKQKDLDSDTRTEPNASKVFQIFSEYHDSGSDFEMNDLR